MQTIKTVIATLGCLGLIVILALWGGARWVSSNKDEIAKSVVELSGIPKSQCDAMEARYQRLWNQAVDSHTVAESEAELAQIRDEIDRLCNAK